VHCSEARSVGKLPRLALALLIAPSAASAQAQSNWWEKAVIYQIYPRSFADSNGDGVGDLNGITQHLDYLKDLGVDAIWITPFFPSPQVDFGYDISDYTGIDPQYGTMADFDRLMAEAKKRDIRVILDFVVNHTSDKHAWFIESRSSRTNPKAHWYVWRDAKPNHQPPNNWRSIFGHSAWQWDPQREQYYYHGFYKEQPDLNWRNPEVRKAMYDAARFWLKKGVAGFRLDAVTTLFEDPKLRDEPILKPGKNAYGDPILTREYTDNLPEVHNVLRELRAVTNEFPGAVLIAEAYLPNVRELVKMYGPRNDEVQLPMDTQLGFINQLSVPAFRARLKEAETQLRGNMPLLVLENHDNPRSLNRYGVNGQPNPSIGKLLAALLLAPRDAALLYYGEELGMVNHDPTRKEDVKDPIGRIGWPKEKGRDGERTPMQWTSGTNAGFGTAKSTWLPVPPDYKTTNVEVEERDPNSLLSFYKALIRLRKENAALHDGDFTLVNVNDNNVLAWLRKTKSGQSVMVALNFTSGAQTVSLGNGRATALLSSFLKIGESSELKNLTLPAYGVYLGQVQ
jgi:alpha-glucosidase